MITHSSTSTATARTAAARFVTAQVSRLQEACLGSNPSRARASLAHLRRAVGKEPGEVPEVLGLIIDPDAPTPRSDEPTREEIAINTALTLYAVHQQSQGEPMHVRGVGFGRALARIRYRDGDEDRGILRRFQSVGTAGTVEELVYHARGLVTLLRGAGVGFDYGRFAQDLLDFQDPWRRDRVRLRWGRDFYRTDENADGSDPSTTSGTPRNQEEA